MTNRNMPYHAASKHSKITLRYLAVMSMTLHVPCVNLAGYWQKIYSSRQEYIFTASLLLLCHLEYD